MRAMIVSKAAPAITKSHRKSLSLSANLHREQAQNMLPLGFRFCPKHEDIILRFLCGKLLDRSFSLNPIIEYCDIYGEDSGQWRRVFEESGEKYHYFFTQLKKKTSNGRRVERRTAGGTWRSQNDEKIFTKEEQRLHIGSVRRFTFVPKNGLNSQESWSMMEFRIDGEVLKEIKNEDYVICLIKKKKNKKTYEAPRPVVPEPNQNDDLVCSQSQARDFNEMSWETIYRESENIIL